MPTGQRAKKSKRGAAKPVDAIVIRLCRKCVQRFRVAECLQTGRTGVYTTCASCGGFKQNTVRVSVQLAPSPCGPWAYEQYGRCARCGYCGDCCEGCG